MTQKPKDSAKKKTIKIKIINGFNNVVGYEINI